MLLNGNNFAIGSLTGSGGTVSLGSSTLTVGGDNSSPPAFAGTIIGSGGALTQTGSGMLTLSGSNTYTAQRRSPPARCRSAAAAARARPATGNIANSGVLVINRGDSGLVISNAITGEGSLVNVGTGTVTISSSNGYTGSTQLTSRRFASGQQLGPGQRHFEFFHRHAEFHEHVGLFAGEFPSISGSPTLGNPTNNGLLTFTASSGTLSGVPVLTVNSPVKINGAARRRWRGTDSGGQ